METPPLFPLRGARALSRRSFLIGSASFAAVALLSTRARGAVTTQPKFSGYPFTLGVASGDPAPDGMVLWTRLAPSPHDVGGGMPVDAVAVTWEIAEDEAMTRVVRSGTAVANPEWAHSVHVEVDGLRPDRWYWYRFHSGGETSPLGRTRTMPALDASPERLRFVFISCQKYESGYYTAFEHMAKEDIDFIVHLGDYIYEKKDDPNGVRRHHLPTSITLDDYRTRYAVYKTDPALQAAHAAVPWIVTWDDHEVTNDYAGGADKNEMTDAERQEFLLRRAAGYQAYFEHMPLRRSALPSGPDALLYRRLKFGQLASFHVLDTRQYRSNWHYAGASHHRFDPGLLDPARTIMGAKQREWFYDGLDRSTVNWNIVAQQVMMARIASQPGPEAEYMMDKWTGFEFERRRTLNFFREHKIKNPVVITGDIHCNWANELIEDFDQLDSVNVGAEFAGTSITSGGDGEAKPAKTDHVLSTNPFVKFFNAERGYVHCEVTPQQWLTNFRTVPYITRRGAPLNTRASFVLESGKPKLNRV